MTTSDWKSIVEMVTAVLSLGAAIAGIVAALKSSSARKEASSAREATTRLEATVGDMRNELRVAIIHTQNLQIANAPRVETNVNVTFPSSDVLQKTQPLDAQQVPRLDTPPEGQQ